MQVSSRDRWIMRWVMLVVWAAATAGLGWAAEHCDPAQRYIMMLPVCMLWLPLTGIMVLTWNPRHTLYW